MLWWNKLVASTQNAWHKQKKYENEHERSLEQLRLPLIPPLPPHIPSTLIIKLYVLIIPVMKEQQRSSVADGTVDTFFLFESGGGMSNYRLLIIEKIFSALSARVEVMFIDRKSSQTNWVILHICRSSHYVRRKWAPLRAYGESSDKAKANNKSKTVTERTKRQMIINFTIGGNEKANDWAANVENDDVDPWWRV